MREHDDRIQRRDAAESDPCHAKAAFRDGNPARFLEQLGAIADANDRGIDGAQHRIASIHPRDASLRCRALADVAGDARHAGELARCVIQRLEGDDDSNRLTVFPMQHRLEWPGRFFGGKCRCELDARRRGFLTQQAVDATSDRLGCRESEHPLRAGAPGQDFPVKRVRDDRFVDRVDDRRQRIVGKRRCRIAS